MSHLLPLRHHSYDFHWECPILGKLLYDYQIRNGAFNPQNGVDQGQRMTQYCNWGNIISAQTLSASCLDLLHGRRNRSGRPGECQTNVCSMVPEKLADVISEVLQNFMRFVWIIGYQANGV